MAKSSIGFVCFIFWGFILFKLGQLKKHSAFWFNVFFWIPFIPPLIYLYVMGIISLSPVWYITFSATSLFLLGWSYALRVASGEDKPKWFILMLLLPVTFIFYLFTKN